MSAQRSPRMTSEVIEPPRDGEFFFLEDVKVDERIAGAMGRLLRRLVGCIDRFGGVVSRHPLLYLVGSAAFGVLATSAVFKI